MSDSEDSEDGVSPLVASKSSIQQHKKATKSRVSFSEEDQTAGSEDLSAASPEKKRHDRTPSCKLPLVLILTLLVVCGGAFCFMSSAGTDSLLWCAVAQIGSRK